MPTAKALLDRWDVLYQQQANHRTLWQDIADYTQPGRNNITTQRADGQKKTEKLFDSTAIHAKNLLRATIHTTLTPDSQPWLSLKLRQEELNDQADIADWLEDCARRIHLALRQSNFSMAVDEMYDDLVGPATGCLYCEEKPPLASGKFGGLRFRAHSAGSYVAAEDAEGEVDTVFRKFKTSARAAYTKWGDKVGEKIADKAKGSKADELVEIMHAVYPRTDRAYRADGKPRRGAKNMAWASCYVACEQKVIIEEGGYEECPFMVPRWSKSPDEVYGYGPSHTALPDIKSTNSMMENTLKALPLAMMPPTIERHDGILGDLDRTPGARNTTDWQGPVGEAIQPLETGYKPDVANDFFMRMDAKIQMYYFVDQLILREKPDMTATEIMAREQQRQRLLGPTAGRLEAEFLNKLVERVFGIMARANAFLPVPEALRDAIGDADIDVEYEGPLARAQRTIELQAQDEVLRWVLAYVQGKTQFPDEVWDVLKGDQWVRDRAEILGLRTDSLNSEEDVKPIRDQRKAMQAEDRKMQQMTAATEMAKNAAPVVTALKPQPGKAA